MSFTDHGEPLIPERLGRHVVVVLTSWRKAKTDGLDNPSMRSTDRGPRREANGTSTPLDMGLIPKGVVSQWRVLAAIRGRRPQSML